MSARELAVEFCRTLQAANLSGGYLYSEWIEWRGYPLFCSSLGVIDRPPFDTFANELATVMLRKRKDERPGHAYRKRKGAGKGKRKPTDTSVIYVIPAPQTGAAVIDLAARRSA